MPPHEQLSCEELLMIMARREQTADAETSFKI